MATSEQAAAPASIPPSMVLYQMGVGHYLSRALGLAAKLRIADSLKNGPRSSREVAAEIDASPAALNRVMRLLASAGIFNEEEGGGFSLTPLGDLLRTDAPGSMRASVMLFAGEGIQRGWGELEYCVRTGQPAFRKLSPGAESAFSAFNADPEAAAAFDDAMAAFSAQTALALVAVYDFSVFGQIADIGGGNGALLVGILQANRGLHGVVFDQPASADRARKRIADAGLESRCEAVAGDFFKEVPRGADAYLLKHVIHDWNDEDAIRILKTCHRAMGERARLLLVEGVYPERITQSLESRGAAFNDVNMLVSTGGRQRSESEFQSLFERAGFRLTKITPSAARAAIIEGERI